MQVNLPAILDEVFMALSEKERDVVAKRFALEGGSRKTLEAIGQSFGVTRERIRQIESTALGKLRRVISSTQFKQVNEIAKQILRQRGGVRGHLPLPVRERVEAHAGERGPLHRAQLRGPALVGPLPRKHAADVLLLRPSASLSSGQVSLTLYLLQEMFAVSSAAVVFCMQGFHAARVAGPAVSGEWSCQ